MTGRGIDQILAFPSDPMLHERFMKSALGYVELAEQVSGPIPRAVSFDYVWGDALSELRRVDPAARIINLETSVTVSGKWEDKGINYRMNPRNVGALAAAGIDACALANNHILDWGEAGLLETVEVLRDSGIRTAGVGRNLEEARSPAMIELSREMEPGRVILFSFGAESSGVPSSWAAARERPGVAFLEDLSDGEVREIHRRVSEVKRENDIVVASIHWGPNWGYEISANERRFARALIDEARVDLVHGHSSHHVKGFEVYRDKLILYGCGDFLNDYEGIQGYEEFRSELVLMYFPRIEVGTGKLLSLRMVPMRIGRFRLNRASGESVKWLQSVLNQEGRGLGGRIRIDADGSFMVRV